MGISSRLCWAAAINLILLDSCLSWCPTASFARGVGFPLSQRHHGRVQGVASGVATVRRTRTNIASGARCSTVRDVATQEDLMNVVQFASQALPNRPDGTVTVIMYTSAYDYACKGCEAEFERMSERRKDCVFLRCYKEFEGAEQFLAQRQVMTLPSFEVFYRGSRVAQVSGPQLDQVELKVKQFGYAVSKTDLFSDDGEYGGGGSERDENGDFAWDRMADKTARDSKKSSAAKDKASTPRTTMRFLPGDKMGTDSEEMRKNGSMMDFFQNRRGGVDDMRGIKIPDAVQAGKGDVSPVGSDDEATNQLNRLWSSESAPPVSDQGGRGEKDRDESALDKIWDDYE